MLDEARTEALALRAICSQAEDVLASDSFLEVPEALVLELVKRDDFSVSKEIAVYDGVKRYEKQIEFLEILNLKLKLQVKVV